MAQPFQIEYTPLEKLVQSQRNARKHDGRQLRQIARSIEAFGFINPIVVDEDNEVIAGHGRLQAAKLLALSRVPVVRLKHLSKLERRAYMLADNKIAENASWDSELLRIELSALASIDIDLEVELTGFSTAEIDVLLNEPNALPQDEPSFPSAPAVDHATSCQGDIWCLGPHRLICGDVRDPDVVESLMRGRTARMVFTDPPYNVPIKGHVSGLGQPQHREFAMASGELSSGAYVALLQDSLGSLAGVTIDGGLHFVCIDWRHLPELHAAVRSIYSGQLNLCVWAKTNGGMGSLYRSQHELVGVFKVGQAPHINNVELGRHGRYRTNVWRYPGMNTFSAERDEALALHPTVKPVQLVADAILDVSRRGDIVLDGFVGSGTTILAAERVGRVAYGVEIEPRYVDVAIERWQNLTGESASLDGDGSTFDEARSARTASDVADAAP